MGADILEGGAGVDTLTGGAGTDIFRFSAGDSGLGAGADRITDFLSGTDKIDLSAIDADSATSRGQAFSFISSGAFSGAAGQLRYSAGGGDTRIEADLDGDSVANFAIVLTGSVTPLVSDFVV